MDIGPSKGLVWNQNSTKAYVDVHEHVHVNVNVNVNTAENQSCAPSE
jgi:hypothetical protein